MGILQDLQNDEKKTSRSCRECEHCLNNSKELSSHRSNVHRVKKKSVKKCTFTGPLRLKCSRMCADTLRVCLVLNVGICFPQKQNCFVMNIFTVMEQLLSVKSVRLSIVLRPHWECIKWASMVLVILVDDVEKRFDSPGQQIHHGVKCDAWIDDDNMFCFSSSYICHLYVLLQGWLDSNNLPFLNLQRLSIHLISFSWLDRNNSFVHCCLLYWL